MDPKPKTEIKKADPKVAVAKLKEKKTPRWQRTADKLLYLAELQEQMGVSGEITFQ